MTTPNGLPAWTRSADHTYYGGHLEKDNYNGEPIVNPKTDVGAGAIKRMATDLAAVARMSDFAKIKFESVGAGGFITVTTCQMMTGAISASYNGAGPPAGFPAVKQMASGVYRITIGTAYEDDYSVSAIFEPVFSSATCLSVGAFVRSYVSGTSYVFVEAYTSTGSGITAGRFSVRIS